MRRWRDDLFITLAFYSRLPVPRLGMNAAARLPAALWTLPVAGLVIAAPSALVLWGAAKLGASALLAATMSVCVYLLTTGALHEDGLADCADGFWGGAEPTRRLAIMRDSLLGSYGVLALVAAFVLRVALLTMALSLGASAALTFVLAAAAAGRTVAIYPWAALPAARQDGLAVALGRPAPEHFRDAAIGALTVTALLIAWRAPFAFMLASLVSAAAVWGVGALAMRKIGGHTGDVIGAAVLVGELAYLGALTMWLA